MTNKINKLIQNKQWYHQRFDGSPMYLWFIKEAEVKKEKRKPPGTEADVRVSFYTPDGKGDWYLDMSDIRRGSDVLIRLARKNPNISAKLLRAWKDDEKKFQSFFDNFDKIRLSNLSDDELLDLFEKYSKLAVNRFTSSAVIDHFALGTDEHIAKMLRQEVGKVGKESRFTEIFSIATAPVHQSFINEAEMELLKIAIEAPRDEKRIADYQKRYFWIKNNYITAQVLPIKHFKKEIALWRKSGADLKAKYEQLRDTSKINARKKAELFKKYRFSRLLRTLLKISEDFTWWQDERKKATYLNIHMGTRILGEMARRRGVEPELTKYLLPPEIKQWFFKNTPSKTELQKRRDRCMVIGWRGGHYVAIGKEVEKLWQIMFPAKKQDVVRDIRGLAASVGRVIGPVKIVGSAREVNKVEKGDILVAVMTRPDYIVGIKKAAAIVTNEGGITCHAAIVSRELGIPCVIGTKIATEVLKDGDIVEVNANHGVVTVIKRK